MLGIRAVGNRSAAVLALLAGTVLALAVLAVGAPADADEGLDTGSDSTSY
jgi:hypothetical protein